MLEWSDVSSCIVCDDSAKACSGLTSSDRRTSACSSFCWFAELGFPALIVLMHQDVRYFQPEDDVLREAQWAWLEQQLAHRGREQPQVTLIGSGIQVG